ncbi:MAG: nuclear transport factor 2 family protein [Pseudomonadota bacterium]
MSLHRPLALLFAAALGTASIAAAAQERKAAVDADVEAARAVVVDFHRALKEGYREGVLKHMDEKAIVFETGFVEARRDQYAAGHLDADMLYAAQVQREIVHREVSVSGDIAVALTQARTRGEFEGQPVSLENTETMVLRRGDDGWKIVHIHWSAHETAPEGR